MAGRWTLLGLLGVGGTASVYEARHRNGRRVALKVLHPELGSSALLRRRFLSEGYAANKVQHPGAVAILDDGEDLDLVFLVMEFFTGRSLAERLADDGPLTGQEVARVSVAVLDVLAAAHDRGVVHRDIKPSNLFELTSGEIKVLDFGVAQVREAGLASVTQSGLTLGTPAFMAPEQAAGRLDEIDALTDIWAVGATMFQLLTGRLVHDAATPNAAIVAAATRAVVPIRELRPDLPGEIAAGIDRALSFRRDQRWPNARSMQKALAAAIGLSQVSPSLSPITVPDISAPHSATRPRGLLVALGALLVLAALVVPFLSRRARSRVVPPVLPDASPSAQPAQIADGRTVTEPPLPVSKGTSSPALLVVRVNPSPGAKREPKLRAPNAAPPAPSPSAAIEFDRLIDTRQ